MFGLFKSSTPESRLSADVKKSLQQEITVILRETGNNEFLAGFAIEAGISSVYKAYIDNAVLLSKGHGLTFEKTISIIKKSTNEIRNKYLVNPEPIK
ncbi:hypothetical protein [Flavobacterium cerinum]|uniref:Uncharacterized protein n=1 Tax=Flavobacterium cerinum TaxID=2502784 RepID=A0A3S3RK72_9FLAO|nr:hypothetical protein [Flavobacterium cerinum]RWX00988.1 hypothetical protein EPI11_08175 [Flavobacterium cerinum]